MFLYMKLFICNLEIILIINVLKAQRKEETGRYVYIDDKEIRQYCHYCNWTALGPYDQDEYVEQKCIEQNYPFENKTDEEEQRNQWRPVCTNGTIPSCPELKKDLNGAWNCSQWQNETDIYFSVTKGTYMFPVYTECTLTCNNEFHVTDTNSIYCNESRQWDADPGSLRCVKVTDLKRNLEGSPSLPAYLVSTIVITIVIMVTISCTLVYIKVRMRRKVYRSASRPGQANESDESHQTQTSQKQDGMDMSECMVNTITSATMTSFQEDYDVANIVYLVDPYEGQIEKNTNNSQFLPAAISAENEGYNLIQECACHQRMDNDTVVEQCVELEKYPLKTPLRNTVSLKNESVESIAKEATRTFANGMDDEDKLWKADSDNGVHDKANCMYEEYIRSDSLQTHDDGDQDEVTFEHEEHINLTIAQKQPSHNLTVSASKECIKGQDESQYHIIAKIEKESSSDNKEPTLKSLDFQGPQKEIGKGQMLNCLWNGTYFQELNNYDDVNSTKQNMDYEQVGNQSIGSNILQLESKDEIPSFHQIIGSNVSETPNVDQKSRKEESENGESNILEEVKGQNKSTVEETQDTVKNDHTQTENETMCRNNTHLDQVIDVEMVTGYKCLEKQSIEENVTIEKNNDKLIEIKLPKKEEMSHCAESGDRNVSSNESTETEMKAVIHFSSFNNNDDYKKATVERTPLLTQEDDNISLANCKGIDELHRRKLLGEKEHDPTDKAAQSYDVVEHLINCGDNIRLQQFLDDVGMKDEEKVLKCLTCSLSLHDGVKKQNKTNTVLSWICNELRKCHLPHKVDVWPAKLAGNNSDQEFPILICNYWGNVIETYRDIHFYGMTVKYQEYDSVNKEEILVRATKEFLESTLSKADAKEANAIVSKNTDMLMETYRNLEMIKPCHVRSLCFQSEDMKTKGKWEVIQETTIVLYCRMKGYIPFGEKLFPKQLWDGKRSLPVDVREGFFVGAMMKGNSTFSKAGENWSASSVSEEEEWDSSLFRMGVSMGPHDKIIQGTVGPFVHLEDNDIGFLTCAHVFGIPSTISNVKGKEVVHPANGEYVSVHGTNNDDVCGHIDRIVFDINPDHPVSVDAAIIKIKAGKIPHKGRFARMDARDLSESGLQPGQNLKFDNGEILKKETIEKELLKHGKFIKVGSKSGVTSSYYLGHEHIVVRVRQDATLDHDDGELSPPIIGGSRAYLMKGQYVITSKSTMPFLVPGDSGCGVFHMDEHKRLRCVGIGIGSMSCGHEAVVTPIQDVLRALDLGEDSLMQFFSTSPNVLESTRL